MNTALLSAIGNTSKLLNVPVFKVGQTVKIHQRIVEGEKTRTQIYEGLIIKIHANGGVSDTITVRKLVDGVGVERIFPIHSPAIAKIEVTREGKVRRSKLYYLRERSGKSARMKTKMLEGQVYEPKSEAALQAEAAAREKAAEDKLAKEKADAEAAVAAEAAAKAAEKAAEEAASAPTAEATPEAAVEATGTEQPSA